MSDIRQYFAASPSKAGDAKETGILTCPHCLYRTEQHDKLENHVQIAHSGKVESTENGNDDHKTLSDFELAQLLAFEDMGIPAELLQEDSTKLQPIQWDSDNSSEDDLWIDCFCGERILLEELDAHSDMHQLELQEGEDLETLYGNAGSGPAAKPSAGLQPGQPKRLGKSELGPFAYEKRMPPFIENLLRKNVGDRIEEMTIGDMELRYSALENETPLLVPKLQLLSRADATVLKSVFCSPVVNHVSKLTREGGFCGYRNTQMIISYLRACPTEVISKEFRGRLPTIFELQDEIESAWAAGHQSIGRIETGGIRNTRKYIGATETQALLELKKVPCRLQAFSTDNKSTAYELMLKAIKEYFDRNRGSHPPPPIYLQYRGHSMTCVGYEEAVVKGQAGTSIQTNLMIFDPMFRIPASIKNMSLKARKLGNKLNMLKAFRYPRSRFRRFHQFELLFLES